MPEPLNYRNAAFPDRRPPSESPPAPGGPRAAIPIEFDTLLTRSTDQAAVAAIETALTQGRIAFFRTDDVTEAVRPAELYIRAADRERAAPIACEVFVRRKKFKAFPRVQLPPNTRLPDL
jgi:hypothetical protein